MPQAKRILKNVDVQFISLVDKGANQKAIILKSEDASAPTLTKTIAIRKTDESKRMVYGVVYAPDEVDAHGDTMTADEIEKAAQSFMKAGRTQQVDKQHDYQAGQGYVAESWIAKDGDPLFSEVGAWIVGIKVENDETWAAIQKGEIAGLSMAGSAVAETVAKRSSLLKRFTEFFQSRQAEDGQVEKDFHSEMERKELWQAISALYAAHDEILYDRYDLSYEEKRAALIGEAEKFITFLQSKTTMSKAETPTPATQPTVEELQARIAELEKAAEAAKPQEPTTPAVDPTVADLQKRLEDLEKRSAGRQGTEGRDTPVQKDFKGIGWV